MSTKTHTIEIDAATAATLERRAAAQGLSVAELIAGLTALHGAPLALPSGDIAALDRQWAAIAAGEATVKHEDVARWLETWGTPAFRPWQAR
jgi:hypothetical protein